MLRQSFHEVAIATRGRGLYEFTREVKRWIEQNKFREGLLTIHLQHTSASLLIQENASPDVQSDFERFEPTNAQPGSRFPRLVFRQLVD